VRRSLCVALATALAATGCNASLSTGDIKIDQKKTEGLARQIAGSGTVPVKSVSCPKGLKAKKGADFDCDLVYADGTKGTITIHQLDDKGRIRTSASDIHIAK
jgi:uncharacterized protein DUF4333